MERCVACTERGTTSDSNLCASCWLHVFGPEAQNEAYRGDGL